MDIETQTSKNPPKTIYNIDDIMDKLKPMTGKEIVFQVTKIMKEKRKDVIENIYKKIEREHFLAIVEKTLKIQNEGGSFFTRNKVVKRENEKILVQEKMQKTAGGVFFSIVKKECVFTKEENKLIFQSQQLLEKESKRVIRELENFLIE
jgi:hypothetical protein